MPSLSGVLANIPGLGGFAAGQEEAQQRQLQQLQQVGILQGIAAKQREAQLAQQTREAMITSGGDPEKAMGLLIQSGNISGAHALAPVVKMAQEAKMRQGEVQGMRDLYGASQAPVPPPPAGMPPAPPPDASQAAPVVPAQPVDPRAARMEKLKQLAVLYAHHPAVVAGIQKEMDKLEATKPLIEHNFPIGDNQVQPHISTDNGMTWKPIPGSQPSAKFSKQVVSVNTGEHSNYTNVQPDGQGGFIGLSKTTQKMEKIPMAEGMQATNTLTPEAIDSAAARYRIDGTLPPNLGRGNQGATNTAKILNAAAASAKAEGNTPEAQRLTQIAGHATTVALNALSTQETKMRAFEGTFRKNADLVESLSNKVDRTGTPVVNGWIQAGQRAVAGNPDIVAFDAAVKGAVNEYAKIVSSATGSGTTAEGEIKKIESILSTKQTKEQVLAVLQTLRKETQNRMDAFNEEKTRLKSSIGSAPAANTVREFATEAEAAAAGLTPGTRVKIGGVTGTWR